MDHSGVPLVEKAVSLLHELVTPDGILASSIVADNYKRIWARDSVVCGLAGILMEDEKVIAGLKRSLLTLASHQHELGMIPSNVDCKLGDVSFGSLVGRVDATTWFVVGACLYYLNTNDKKTWEILAASIEKCRTYLKAIEFNDRGWIYTPLSGNWADEYPVHGYTLFDNALRIWGENLWCKINGETSTLFHELKDRTLKNFWLSTEVSEKDRYQTIPYKNALSTSLNHFVSFIIPGKYDTRFDAAGNGLMMLNFDLNEQQLHGFSTFVKELQKQFNELFIPAFWPVITSESEDWHLLKGNYSYSFKNTPGYFHNGAIWPVWAGLFSIGLAKNGMTDAAENIRSSQFNLIHSRTDWDFHEYFDTVDFKPGGKTKMGYTASGIIFMNQALESNRVSQKFHL